MLGSVFSNVLGFLVNCYDWPDLGRESMLIGRFAGRVIGGTKRRKALPGQKHHMCSAASALACVSNPTNKLTCCLSCPPAANCLLSLLIALTTWSWSFAQIFISPAGPGHSIVLAATLERPSPVDSPLAHHATRPFTGVLHTLWATIANLAQGWVGVHWVYSFDP